MKHPKESIPEHHEGTAVDVEESVEQATPEKAGAFYQVVKKRLLSVNEWHNMAGPLSAVFVITDSKGGKVVRPPQQGDYFKISVPAPGLQTGEGFDWVQVEEITQQAAKVDEYLSIRVRPASSPLNTDADTAHFYTGAATSNFIVYRKGNRITAGVYGRNETPNVQEAAAWVDKLRNAVVGTGGISGFSKRQWKALVEGWLRLD